MNKRVLSLFFGVFLIVSMSFVSAGFFWEKKITGNALFDDLEGQEKLTEEGSIFEEEVGKEVTFEPRRGLGEILRNLFGKKDNAGEERRDKRDTDSKKYFSEEGMQEKKLKEEKEFEKFEKEKQEIEEEMEKEKQEMEKEKQEMEKEIEEFENVLEKDIGEIQDIINEAHELKFEKFSEETTSNKNSFTGLITFGGIPSSTTINQKNIISHNKKSIVIKSKFNLSLTSDLNMTIRL